MRAGRPTCGRLSVAKSVPYAVLVSFLGLPAAVGYLPMRFDTGQHMRMSQQMKLAPRMIQSMEILQMPMQALEERIEQELASNPTLELREAGDERGEILAERVQEARDDREGERTMVVGENGPATQSGERASDDFERLNNFAEEQGDAFRDNAFESDYDYRRKSSNGDGERDKKLDALANTAARSASLYDQLMDQWRMAEVDDATRRAGEHLIGFIDADGYIRTDEAQIRAAMPPDVEWEDVQRAWHALQEWLEPSGLAARDLRECLLLQIDARQRAQPHRDYKCERALVAEHLKDIEGNRLPKIAKALECDIDEVKRALLSLRQFHPHPGRLLAEETQRHITPDAIVEFDEDRDAYVARLTRDRQPALSINPAYRRMLKDGGLDKRTKDFVGTNMRSARWLLDAIMQRNSTLLRVINVVLAAQRDYFDQGPQHLKPLPMTLVADQLGIHVATVSRAVNEKYLQTPRGIVPLRMFFSGGTETESGESMSWAAVQAKLEEIIKNEDKREPLSDDQLVDELKKAGIEIARRTVAKYRSQLDIPPARQRREY